MCEIHISSRKTISPALCARPCARNFTQVRAFNFKVSADGRAKALIAVSRRASRSPASTSPHPTPPRPVSHQPVRYAARTRISFSCQLWWIRLSNTGAPRRGARSDAIGHGLWFLIRVLLSAISARGGGGGGRAGEARRGTKKRADRRASEVGTLPPPLSPVLFLLPRDFTPASRDYARAWGSVTRLARVASSVSLSLYRPGVTLLLSCLSLLRCCYPPPCPLSVAWTSSRLRQR